jgi:hypothetical protein
MIPVVLSTAALIALVIIAKLIAEIRIESVRVRHKRKK